MAVHHPVEIKPEGLFKWHRNSLCSKGTHSVGNPGKSSLQKRRISAWADDTRPDQLFQDDSIACAARGMAAEGHARRKFFVLADVKCKFRQPSLESAEVNFEQ